MYIENKEPSLHQFSTYDVDDFYHCVNNPPYFCRTLKLVYGSNVIMSMCRFCFIDDKFVIVRGERKSGKSTLLNAMLLWIALFRKNQSIALISYNQAISQLHLEQIKQWYLNLPSYMKMDLSCSKNHIQFENGSGIYASSIRSNSLRGKSFSMIAVDEASSCPETELVHFQDNIFPTIYSGKNTQIIITGTSNQNVIFDRMWCDTNTQTGVWSNFKPLELVRYV